MRQSRPSALMGRGLKVAWSLLLLGGGAFLLCSLATAEEWRAAWAAGLRVGAPVLVLLALPAVSHFIKMLGWRALLPREHRPPLPRAYAAFVAAQGINELGLSVLGEPLKVMVLSAEGRAAGVKAVVADNLAALAALFAVIATLAQLGAAALPVLALSFIILRYVQSERWSGVLTAFLAHYVGKLWMLVELGLGLHFLGQPPLAATGQLALACLGAAAVGAPVPGQLGVVEAALLHTGGVLGIATSSLVTLALIRRLRSLLWIAIGFALATRIARRKKTDEPLVSTALA